MRQNRTATFCTVRQLPICEFYVVLKPGQTENRQIKPNLLKYCKLRTASNPGQLAGVTDCPTNLAFFCPIITEILVRNLQIFCPELAFLKLWTLFPSFQSKERSYMPTMFNFSPVQPMTICDLPQVI